MRPKACRGLAGVIALGFFLAGCSSEPTPPNPTPPGNGTTPQGGPAPTFTLAWSEYPSWSVFGVASDKGLIDGKKGEQGRLEKKWGVDIELQLLQYEPCITAYQSKTSDAVCVTNMDVLNPAL